MMLRWMLTNLLRQAARRKVSESVAAAVRHAAAGNARPEEGAELPPCEVAVVFATNLESEDFAARLEDRVTTRCASFVEHSGRMGTTGVVVAETGLGGDAACGATGDLIAVHRPAWVVSAGFAGALAAELRRGQILMADCVIDREGNEFQVGLHIDRDVLRAQRHLHVGRLLTLDGLLRAPEEKLQWAQRCGAVAYDSETWGVAAACARQRVRFLSVRIITDTLDDRLPVEVERMFSRGSLASKLGAATGALLKRPGSVKDWWHYQQQGLQAADRLAKFLSGVLPQLTVAAAKLPGPES